MNYLLSVTILLIFAGCNDAKQPSPTQNSVLNTVSNSSAQKKRSGFLQEEVDSWLHNTPKEEVSKKEEKQHIVKESHKEVNVKTTQKQMSEKKGFLQEQLDAASKSMESDHSSPSHVEEMKTMPAIGN
jgi:hypothetical protein